MPQGPIATLVTGLTPSKTAKSANVDANGNLVTAASSPLPSGSVPVSSSSGNVANAAGVATLAAAAGKTTYLSGFAITAAGATAAGVVLVTVAGLLGGTATYVFAVPAGASIGATPLAVTFPSPIPASAVNTAIVVTLPALGTGNTNAAVVATGFQL